MYFRWGIVDTKEQLQWVTRIDDRNRARFAHDAPQSSGTSDVPRVATLTREKFTYTCGMGWHRSTAERPMQVNSRILRMKWIMWISSRVSFSRPYHLEQLVFERDFCELILVPQSSVQIKAIEVRHLVDGLPSRSSSTICE